VRISDSSVPNVFSYPSRLPQAEPAPAPAPEPAEPESSEPPAARPGWRPAAPKKSKKDRKLRHQRMQQQAHMEEMMGPPPETTFSAGQPLPRRPVGAHPAVSPRTQVQSWATWMRKFISSALPLYHRTHISLQPIPMSSLLRQGAALNLHSKCLLDAARVSLVLRLNPLINLFMLAWVNCINIDTTIHSTLRLSRFALRSI